MIDFDHYICFHTGELKATCTKKTNYQANGALDPDIKDNKLNENQDNKQGMYS